MNPRASEDTGNRTVQGEGASKMEFTFQFCDPEPDSFHEEHLNPSPSCLLVKPAFVACLLSPPPQTCALLTEAELGQHIKHLNPATVLTPEAKPPPSSSSFTRHFASRASPLPSLMQSTAEELKKNFTSTLAPR